MTEQAIPEVELSVDALLAAASEATRCGRPCRRCACRFRRILFFDLGAWRYVDARFPATLVSIMHHDEIFRHDRDWDPADSNADAALGAFAWLNHLVHRSIPPGETAVCEGMRHPDQKTRIQLPRIQIFP